MKTLLSIAFAVSLGVAPKLTAAPSIAANGVKNSASYANPGFPNGAIAQGSLFVVFGSGLGPAAIQYAGSFPLPTTLSGTSASVTVAGNTVPCIMIYTSAGQIAAILPSNTPVGTGAIAVTYNGVDSPAAPIKVVKSSVGLFTRNQQGSGAAVVQDANYNYNSTVNAFQPGQTVILWATGLGPVAGSDANAPPSGNLPGINVTASVGNQTAVVAYAGRSQFAGVDQINIVLPSGISGCYVPLSISVGGLASNFVTISTAAAAGPCSDPSLPGGSGAIPPGGTFRIGSVVLTRIGSISGNLTSTTDIGAASFLKYDAAAYLDSRSNAGTVISDGTCLVLQPTPGSSTSTQSTPLDAGPQINVAGPNGNKPLTKPLSSNIGTYSALLGMNLGGQKLYLDPGTYNTDNGAGGADVGAFKLTLTEPPTFAWTNATQITSVDRSKPLPITWSGGDPNSEVFVLGSSYIDDNNFAEFVCLAKDSTGGLTVPASILSALPPSVSGSDRQPHGSLIVETSTQVTGTAPGLDQLNGTTLVMFSKSGVAFQ